jgi:hypothetical protein
MTGGATDAGFAADSRACFEDLVGWLAGGRAAGMTHADLEDELTGRGRELLRRLLQDHLSLRTLTEPRRAVVADDAGVVHGRVETGHHRVLASVFGPVQVVRLAYRRAGHQNLHPADAVLNLPVQRNSHGLRRIAAIEAAQGSFEQAAEAIGRATGQRVGKRQVEELTTAAAADITDFYATRPRDQPADGDVLVISADGKGIVMRPDALRPATAARAASNKLTTRLSKGERRYRKRMAEVGAVYDLTPVPRQAADVLAPKHHPTKHDRHDRHDPHPAAPVAVNKWLTASVVEDAAEVITDVFDQAERRDPRHTRTWVALVDGNNHQIDRIHTEAKTRGVQISIVVDLIHVMEYLWDAAWCFFPEADPAAETWVRDRTLTILDGGALNVATGLRRRATLDKLPQTKRAKADRAAAYLNNKAAYLDYPTALANGWPVATGIIEGACRHLVADRMDITGARWSIAGAEAILKLRAVRTNGDFDTYWRYHLGQEHQRVHRARYANDEIPLAA